MLKDTALLNQLLIVIVLYGRQLAQCDAFRSLSRALAQHQDRPFLLIHDNSPEPQACEQQGSWQLTYQSDPSNPGVSKAYNEAFRLARRLDVKWLLLVDQDTDFPADIFTVFASAVQANPNTLVYAPILRDKKGLCSPFRLQKGKGVRLKSIHPGIHAFRELYIINSGMLLAVDAFEKAGGYDESFPLDYSDIAFIERLRLRVTAFCVVEVICRHHHSSSDPDAVQLLKRFRQFCDATLRYAEGRQEVKPLRILLPRALRLLAQTGNPAALAHVLKIKDRPS